MQQNTVTQFVSKAMSEYGSIQDYLNEKTSENWKTKGQNWGRAISVESVEMLNHIGWAWWKKQTPDMPQAFMELVDIFHFWISAALEYGLSDDHSINENLNDDVDVKTLCDFMTMTGSNLAISTEHAKTILIQMAAAMILLCKKTGYTTEDLFTWYAGKNALNLLRRNHGYKTGEYVKTWAGEEDNVHLERLIKHGKGNTIQQFYKDLLNLYVRVGNKNATPVALTLPEPQNE